MSTIKNAFVMRNNFESPRPLFEFLSGSNSKMPQNKKAFDKKQLNSAKRLSKKMQTDKNPNTLLLLLPPPAKVVRIQQRCGFCGIFYYGKSD